MQEKIKKYALSRLKIAGYIFALVGWFFLIVVPMDLLGYDLSGLERFVEGQAFVWGLRIVVLALMIILVTGQKALEEMLERNRMLALSLKIILWVGVAGWVIGLGSLLFL